MKKFIDDNRITTQFVDEYTKTTYRILGEHKHSAIKPCHWLEQRLLTGRDNRNCYKGVFGVKSHRCLQNSPSLPFCNHQCVFCWRDTVIGTLGTEFLVEPDEPKDLVNEMLRHQKDIIENHLPLRRYLENYEVMLDILYFMLQNKTAHTIDSISNAIHVSKNKIDRAVNLLKNQSFIHPQNLSINDYKLDNEIECCIDNKNELETLVNRALTTPDEIMQAHAEARFPNHAAISLDGEPMLYPKIAGLIEEFRKRNMTTFVVTNSTLPEKIKELETFPSQFYFTLAAPNEQIYKKVCRPMVKDSWNKIQETLEYINSLSCRTLIRLTAVKDLNINNEYIKDYSKIIEKANPNFFEIKGFTLQARALDINKRLNSDKHISYFFPDYNYLNEIASKFEKIGNFPLIYKNEVSRDFLFAVNWNNTEDPIIKSP